MLAIVCRDLAPADFLVGCSPFFFFVPSLQDSCKKLDYRDVTGNPTACDAVGATTDFLLSKSRPAAMNLSSSMATSSSAASSPIASECPVMPVASGKPDSRMRIEPSSFDAASTSQGQF